MVKFGKVIDFQYSFEEALSNEDLANCLIELIQYFVYIRYQIPMPYISLKKQYEMQRERWKTISLSSRKSKSYKDWCKMSMFVENFSRLTNSLMNIIHSFSVKKIVIMFGSTTVSPKETIVIVNNINTTQNEVSTHKIMSNSCRKLLKTLITGDLFFDLPVLRCKKIYILVCLHNTLPSIESDIFLPRPNFKQPTRGIVHYFNLSNDTHEIQLAANKDILRKQLIFEDLIEEERKHDESEIPEDILCKQLIFEDLIEEERKHNENEIPEDVGDKNVYENNMKVEHTTGEGENTRSCLISPFAEDGEVHGNGLISEELMKDTEEEYTNSGTWYMANLELHGFR